MWSSRRKFGFGLAAVIGLTACGYSPAYGPKGSARNLFNRVEFKTPASRNEFDLVGQFEQRLGHGEDAKFRLTYDVSTSQDGTGLTPAQERIRFNVVGRLSYTLTDTTSGQVLTRGTVENFTGYSVASVDVTATPPGTSATISTLSAKRDASRRLMVILADQVVTRLIASSPGWAL